MVTTYEPQHPLYRDEADVRGELTRVFDVCQDCRRCADSCSSFPTLFDLLDRQPDRDAGLLTPAQQDQVVTECFQCKLCHLECPYTPDRHELGIDFPRLMLRARAMRRANGLTPGGDDALARLVERTGVYGAVARAVPSLANRLVGAEPNSVVRKVTAAATGLSAVRLVPSFASERFSTWFAKRPKITINRPQGRVTVFPTCIVEYHEPDIGKDLVRVYERNGVECDVTGAGCCGAPSLHAGDVEHFGKVARRNVADLADAVRRGTDVVVAQPTCGYVIKHHYPEYVGDPTTRAEAELVAAHTYDATEYLIELHRSGDTSLDTAFGGETVESIVYHASCHLRAQEIGLAGRDLMKLTGADVTVVDQCAGSDGVWGLRTSNETASGSIAGRLGEQIGAAGGDVVAGDCHVANTAIEERTGRRARHPLEVVARAYGIADDRKPLASDRKRT